MVDKSVEKFTAFNLLWINFRMFHGRSLCLEEKIKRGDKGTKLWTRQCFRIKLPRKLKCKMFSLLTMRQDFGNLKRNFILIEFPVVLIWQYDNFAAKTKLLTAECRWSPKLQFKHSFFHSFWLQGSKWKVLNSKKYEIFEVGTWSLLYFLQRENSLFLRILTLGPDSYDFEPVNYWSITTVRPWFSP